MRDFEDDLRASLTRAGDHHVDEVRPELGSLRARILRGSNRRRVVRSGAMVAGFVVVVAATALAWPGSPFRSDPQPADPAPFPAPEIEGDESPLPDRFDEDQDPRCVETRFVSTTEGWPAEPESEMAAAEMTPNYVATWRDGGKKSGRFIDVFSPDSGYALTARSSIQVLSRRASIGQVHEGFGVEFRYSGCEYALNAFGLTRAELAGFARGLTLASDDQVTFVYPDLLAGQARAACDGAEEDGDQWRYDKEEVINFFTTATMEWHDWLIEPFEEEPDSYILKDPTIDRSGIVVRLEQIDDCWEVASVSMPQDHQKRPTGLSVSVDGRRVLLGYSRYGASSFDVTIRYENVEVDVPTTDKTFVEVELPDVPEGPGNFIIRYRNEAGEVFGARSLGVPGGDFSAG